VLNHLKPDLGDWVTVVGQGAIGLLMTQVALMKGCRVIAVDVDDYVGARKYGRSLIKHKRLLKLSVINKNWLQL
jgi:D-arabinose 1-dehydrogenase-like Zn-dependent alcohol dehydrogenase